MRVEVQRKDAAKHARRNSVMSSTDGGMFLCICFYGWSRQPTTPCVTVDRRSQTMVLNMKRTKCISSRAASLICPSEYLNGLANHVD